MAASEVSGRSRHFRYKAAGRSASLRFRCYRPGRIDIEAVGDQQQPTGKNAAKQDHGQWIEAFVEVGRCE
jgi:hypothetical protein